MEIKKTCSCNEKNKSKIQLDWILFYQADTGLDEKETCYFCPTCNSIWYNLDSPHDPNPDDLYIFLSSESFYKKFGKDFPNDFPQNYESLTSWILEGGKIELFMFQDFKITHPKK